MLDQYLDSLNVHKENSYQYPSNYYKKAILKQHPDKGGSSDEYLKTQLAYKTLQNSHTRKIYDEYGPKGAEFYNIIMDF